MPPPIGPAATPTSLSAAHERMVLSKDCTEAMLGLRSCRSTASSCCTRMCHSSNHRQGTQHNSRQWLHRHQAGTTRHELEAGPMRAYHPQLRLGLCQRREIVSHTWAIATPLETTNLGVQQVHQPSFQGVQQRPLALHHGSGQAPRKQKLRQEARLATQKTSPSIALPSCASRN